MRVPASSIIGVNPDGSFRITKPVKIGGVLLNNVTFSSGVQIGNVDLASLADKELEVEPENGVTVIKAYYE